MRGIAIGIKFASTALAVVAAGACGSKPGAVLTPVSEVSGSVRSPVRVEPVVWWTGGPVVFHILAESVVGAEPPPLEVEWGVGSRAAVPIRGLVSRPVGRESAGEPPDRFDAWVGGLQRWTAGQPSANSQRAVMVGVWSPPAEWQPGDRAAIRVNGQPVVVRAVEKAPPGGGWVGAGSVASVTEEPLGRWTPPRFWWRERLTRGEGLELAVDGEGRIDPVARRIDQQETDLWQAAVLRLRRIDGELAGAIVRRLDGRIERLAAPVWVDSPESLLQLRSELLAHDLADPEVARRARAWLEAQPPAAAWVIDDAGLRDAESGVPILTVGVINLRETMSAVSVRLEGAPPAEQEFVTLDPYTFARVTVPGAEGVGDAMSYVTVRCGPWTKRLPVAAAAIAARPPGLAIGPLAPDRTMGDMAIAAEPTVLGSPVVASLERTFGRLYRGGDASKPAAGVGWTVYIECERTSHESADDAVTILLGSAGADERRIQVRRANADRPPAGVRVVEGADRWMCWVPIPAEAIERDGRLRIGVVREIASGERSDSRRGAWPRPMLPWDASPGRVLVDLGAWSGLEAPGPAAGVR